MKKHQKGFMLAEVIVVSTIVITVLTSLYISFNKLYSNYKVRFKYYDANGLYAASKISNFYIDEFLFSNYLNDLENNDITDISCNNSRSDYNYCKKIFDTYNVIKMYLVKYDLTGKNFSNELINDYVSYLTSSDNWEKDLYNYRIIVVMRNELGEESFANLKMR